MRLVLCVSWRPHGCVSSAEDVKQRQQAIPEGYADSLTNARLAHAVKQTRLCGTFARRPFCRKAMTRLRHVRGVLESAFETDRRAKPIVQFVRVPLQNRVLGGRDARDHETAAANGRLEPAGIRLPSKSWAARRARACSGEWDLPQGRIGAAGQAGHRLPSDKRWAQSRCSSTSPKK